MTHEPQGSTEVSVSVCELQSGSDMVQQSSIKIQVGSLHVADLFASQRVPPKAVAPVDVCIDGVL